jgi:hypothetical protein
LHELSNDARSISDGNYSGPWSSISTGKTACKQAAKCSSSTPTSGKLNWVGCGDQETTPATNGRNNVQNDPVVIEPVDELIRREIPQFDGIYIEGSVQGIDVNVTVDTGATTTLISNEVYNKIPDEIKPAVVQLLTRTHITTADGAELKHRGVAMFDLCLGPVAMKKSFLIADIKDDVLLGADVIQKDVRGPADILLSEGKMLLRGQAVPIHQVVHTKVSQARNVRAADHYIIPPMSEKLVDVLLENLSSVDHGDDVLLLESDDNLPEKCQVVMASTLVDASRSATVKVRLMNPFDSPVSIKQDTVLGTAEGGCEVQGTLFHADGSAGLLHNGREKVRITQSSSIPNQLPNSLHEEDAPVLLPLHLQELYDAVCASKSSEERELIARLLTEYSDVFFISDDDLGLTHLTEHAIITGDAAPVKQAPRRVPIAFVGEEQKALEKLQRQGTIRPSTSP